MALTQKDYQQRFIQKRKQDGLCIDCGVSLDRIGARCEKCNKKHVEYGNESRKWYKSHGICPRCGKKELYGDEKMCLECKAITYETNMRSRKKLGKEHYNTMHAQWAKKKHKERIENGICTRCGKRKADYGFKTCGICREKIRNQKRKESKSEDRRERVEKGLCFFCDNPVLDGYKVCKEHYDKNIKNLQHPKCREATKRIKEDNKRFFTKSN